VQELSRNRFATSRYAAPLAALALFSAAAAHAASTECAADDASLSCRLTGVLHWLEAAALVLGIVLIAVIAVAVHLIRKNRLSRKEGR
jgi:uncharacterized membrane protein YhdT